MIFLFNIKNQSNAFFKKLFVISDEQLFFMVRKQDIKEHLCVVCTNGQYKKWKPLS